MTVRPSVSFIPIFFFVVSSLASSHRAVNKAVDCNVLMRGYLRGGCGLGEKRPYSQDNVRGEECMEEGMACQW